jgi:hypothetical protein
MDKNDKGGFNVHVYSPGNMFANNITFEAPVYIGGGNNPIKQNGFTDENIKNALMNIVGEKKPIDTQWKWAGAYWYLRWACKYPVDMQKFCDKVNGLLYEGEKWGVECKYESVRKYYTLSFMSEDACKMENVRYSRSDEQVFQILREIALQLAEELGKSYLSNG